MKISVLKSIQLSACSLLMSLLLCNISAIAQQTNKVADEISFLRSASSPKGNYVMLNSSNRFHEDSALYNSTAHFIILKQKKNKSVEKKDVLVKPFTTLRQMKTLFREEELVELQNLMNCKSLEEVMEKLRVDKNPSSYPFLYMDVRIQIALGHAWLDEDVENGQVYTYYVYREDALGKKEPWGAAVQMAKKDNAGLFQYQTNNTAINSSDSSVSFSWVTTRISTSSTTPSSIKDSLSIAGFNDEIFVHHTELMQRLYVMKNGVLQPSQLILSRVEEGTNNKIANGIIPTHPDDEIMAWAVPEDIFGNQGKPSDTIFAYAISYSNAPLLTQIKAKDIVDGVHLSWPKLPQKPYIKGVKIQRYNSDNLLEDIATLPASDTSFDDYKMQIGHTYRYEASVLFAQSLGFEQKIPAQATGAYTKFSKPVPPVNLRAVQEEKNIRLDWDGAQVKGLYGYHIYRGYDGTTPTLLAGPITEPTSYIDTSAELSGKSVYTYYVITENLRQDVSLPSEPVNIKPNRAVKVFPPSTVQTYYANGRVNLTWDDARTMDSYITGFQVQRRVAKTGSYQNLGSVVTFAQTIDSTIAPGVVYEYRVASIGTANEVSAYSEGTQFELPVEKDFSKVTIAVRNTHKGVAINWPAIERPAQTQFVLYRRLATADKMEPLVKLPLGTSSYTDQGVTAGQNYVYAIALEFGKDGDGPLGTAVSIKHKPTAKPEILK